MASVIRVYLGIVHSARNRHVGEATIDQLLVPMFGVHVDQDAVCGLTLAAVAGDRIAIIDVRPLVDVELDSTPGVRANSDVAITFDLFNGPKLAVGNM